MPNVMEEFDLLEISAVDRPAQAHAKAVIIKRAGGKTRRSKKSPAGGTSDISEMGPDEEDEIESKGKKTKKFDDDGRMAVVLTSAEDGHTHLLHLGSGMGGGSSTYNTGDAEESHGHDHPWAMNAEGALEIGMADGHTHTVTMEDVNSALLRLVKNDSEDSAGDSEDTPAAPSATKQEADMPNAKKSDESTQLEEQVDTLTKANERNENIVALKAEDRAHFDGLDSTEAQDEFLGKSTDERADVLKALTDGDPVIYKSISGDEFHRSDDPRLVTAVKAADIATKTATDEREARQGLELEKRASELLPNLPGTPAVRGALLKAVESISDETLRDGALEAIKAANGGIFERAGGTPEENGLAKGEGYKPTPGNAEAKLDALAVKYAEAESVPLHKAYSEVLNTDEGAALYQEYSAQG